MCMRVVLFPTCDLRSHFSTLLHTFGGKNDHQCHLHNYYFSYMFNNDNDGSDQLPALQTMEMPLDGDKYD